jgi:hypothetical protein
MHIQGVDRFRGRSLLSASGLDLVMHTEQPQSILKKKQSRNKVMPETSDFAGKMKLPIW